MRLVDFLILMLKAHAETLKGLSDLLGEDVVFAILERTSEEDDTIPPLPQKHTLRVRTEATAVRSGSAYMELQDAVHHFHLPGTLEFHIWAYPHYRTFIESPFDLDSVLEPVGQSGEFPLAEEAITQAKKWISKIPGPAAFQTRIQQVSDQAWLRFRTQVFQKAGKKPLVIARPE